MKPNLLCFLLVLVLVTVIFVSGCTGLMSEPLKPGTGGGELKTNKTQDTGLETNKTPPQPPENNKTQDTNPKTNNTQDSGLETPPVIPQSVSIPISTENNCVGFLIGSEQEMQNIKLVGAGFARPHPGPFAWGFIEKQKGIFDFSDTDAYVKKAQDNNVAILATIWPFADWDQQSDAGCKVSNTDTFAPQWPGGEWQIPQYRCKPKDMNAYAVFLKKLVERYDGDGIEDMPGLKMPIKYWEVLNEPEMKSDQLTFFLGDETDYLDILKSSHATIKETCTDCKVVQAGCAGTQDEFLYFWGNVFALGAADYFDIANIHHIGGPDTSTLNVKDFKKLLDKYNIKKPIWVTEAEFKDSSADVKSSAKGAFDNGAEKIFFVSFNVGGHSPPKPGQYAPVYKEITQSCPKKSSQSDQQGLAPTSDLKFTVTEDGGTRVSGSVPYAFRLDNGKIRLYYCEAGITSAISNDGLNFAIEGSTGLEGCDPTIVKLSDGKIRMYYKMVSGQGGPQGGPGQSIHKVYSAISDDGQTFQKEGLVIDSEKTGDGGWASVPEAIKLPDGKVRIYYVSNDPEAMGGIMSAISSNGIDFEKENGARIKGPHVDPAITILADGRYWLLAIYHCINPQTTGCSQSEDGIYSYLSDDGLSFTNKQLIYYSTAALDPGIMKIDGSIYRIYYGSMQTNGLVNTKSIVVSIGN